jgi:hypothetical protein
MSTTNISLPDLPLDVQYIIYSYLIAPLASYTVNPMPRTFWLRNFYDHHPADRTVLSLHPFLNLAATCKSLRFCVESYCHHLLRQYRQLQNVKLPDIPDDDWVEMVAKQKARDRKKRVHTYRLTYLKWAFAHCIFCGKVSKKRAIFNQLIWCCNPCDIDQYGRRIVGPYRQSYNAVP